MAQFVYGGPKRYAHQLMALKKMISCGGVGALLMEPGCVYGDAEVVVNRGGKSFRTTMLELVEKQNGAVSSNGGRWDPKISTRVQYKADDGTIRLTEVVNAWESGVKPTYEVRTTSGRTVRATDEHPFLTAEGWRRLDELQVGQLVYVRGGQRTGGRRVKQTYLYTSWLPYHPYARQPERSKSPNRVLTHRLVAEAEMNGLDYGVFLAKVKAGNVAGLRFLDPSTHHVHHVNHDPRDNRLENLRVMTVEEHHREHADAGKTSQVLYKAALEEIESVTYYGEEPTYDIEVSAPEKNFLADGFVVHNTGKTCVSLDFCSVLALKQPKVDGVQETRVLVIAPLAAVDTWVQQAKVWTSPQVNVWVEAVGGSIQQRAETLASRGGQRMTKGPLRRRRVKGGTVLMDTPERAEGWHRSWDWYGRSSQRFVQISDGPDGLGTDKPRLVIEVINIDTLSSRQAAGKGTMADRVLDGIKRYNPHLVIIDESHRIKGHTSNVSRLADRIGQAVPKRMILTGTVMPAGPMDVFSQWRFLDPYAFGDVDEDGVRRRATFQRFQSRFAVMGGYLGHQVVGYRNMDELQNIMGQRAAVVLKRDALDLPPVTEVVVPVMLTAAEKKAYMDMKKSLAYTFGGGAPGNGPTATVNNALVQIMRLRQITAGHLPDDMGIVREIGTSKVDTINSIVHDQLTGEKRIVIFTLFTHELEMIKRKLQKPGTIVESISGATPQAERVAIRQRFGDKSTNERIVLVAQIKTLSLAVNELVSASNVIFGSLSQQRDDLIQAIDRLNRIGQEGEKVTVWYAEAPGTIDGVIHQSHRDGTSLEQAVLDHVMQFNPSVDDLMGDS